MAWAKGRQEQPVKYKAEVLKLYPGARWIAYKTSDGSIGAIMFNDKRISQAYSVAWKAWECAYYTHQNNLQDQLFKY